MNIIKKPVVDKNITVFAGKGGVGKTTCAAATAFHYASLGKRTLCLSTDPTPSLSHIFEIERTSKPAKVCQSLYIKELGIEEVREMWDMRFGREVYEVFSTFVSVSYDKFTEFMTSVLPGMSDEFIVDYIRELYCRSEYDAIVWDTAPLGQTLALLQTPSLLVDHLKLAPRIYSRLKVGDKSKQPILDILRRWEKLSALNMDFLMKEVKFSIVAILEALSVNQLEYIFQEMARYDLQIKQIVINNKVKADGSAFMALKSTQQRYYLDQIHDRYSDLQINEIAMFPYEIKGIDRLAEVARMLFSECYRPQ
jgi:arsenite-transporting ATPase